jgi:hypothetical protein
MNIKNQFDLKQKVYLITDPDQDRRLVKAIIVTAQGIKYLLVCGTEESEHFAFEMSAKKSLEFDQTEDSDDGEVKA